jgi:hypothetical protein
LVRDRASTIQHASCRSPKMERFEAHLAQLASWLHGREALLKSLQELLRRGMTEK